MKLAGRLIALIVAASFLTASASACSAPVEEAAHLPGPCVGGEVALDVLNTLRAEAIAAQAPYETYWQVDSIHTLMSRNPAGWGLYAMGVWYNCETAESLRVHEDGTVRYVGENGHVKMLWYNQKSGEVHDVFDLWVEADVDPGAEEQVEGEDEGVEKWSGKDPIRGVICGDLITGDADVSAGQAEPWEQWFSDDEFDFDGWVEDMLELVEDGIDVDQPWGEEPAHDVESLLHPGGAGPWADRSNEAFDMFADTSGNVPRLVPGQEAVRAGEHTDYDWAPYDDCATCYFEFHSMYDENGNLYETIMRDVRTGFVLYHATWGYIERADGTVEHFTASEENWAELWSNLRRLEKMHGTEGVWGPDVEDCEGEPDEAEAATSEAEEESDEAEAATSQSEVEKPRPGDGRELPSEDRIAILGAWKRLPIRLKGNVDPEPDDTDATRIGSGAFVAMLGTWLGYYSTHRSLGYTDPSTEDTGSTPTEGEIPLDCIEDGQVIRDDRGWTDPAPQFSRMVVSRSRAYGGGGEEGMTPTEMWDEWTEDLDEVEEAEDLPQATPTPTPTAAATSTPTVTPTPIATPTPTPTPTPTVSADMAGPTITGITDTPDPIYTTGTDPDQATVSASITDSSGVVETYLQYRRQGEGDWVYRGLTVDGTVYSGVLGPFDYAGTIEYRFRARDGAGNWSTSGTYTISVTLP